VKLGTVFELQLTHYWDCGRIFSFSFNTFCCWYVYL